MSGQPARLLDARRSSNRPLTLRGSLRSYPRGLRRTQTNMSPEATRGPPPSGSSCTAISPFPGTCTGKTAVRPDGPMQTIRAGMIAVALAKKGTSRRHLGRRWTRRTSPTVLAMSPLTLMRTCTRGRRSMTELTLSPLRSHRNRIAATKAISKTAPAAISAAWMVGSLRNPFTGTDTRFR